MSRRIHAVHDSQSIIPGLPDEIALTCLAKISHGYHGILECVSKRWRDTIRSSYYSSLKSSQGWSGNWLFAMSCAKESIYLDAYDPDANRWHTLCSTPPTALGFDSFKRYSCVVACKKLLVIRGYFSDQKPNHVMCFDPYKKQWSMGSCMGTGRFCHACASVGGKVYVAGGYEFKTEQILNSAEVYDPILDSWEYLPEMPCYLRTGTGLAIGGEFHVFGYGEDFVYLIYDPVSCKWRQEECVSHFRRHNVNIYNTIEINNEVFHIENDSVSVLDKETKRWKRIGALPPVVERYDYLVYGLFAIREILYVIAGPILDGSLSGDLRTNLLVLFCDTRNLPLEWQDGKCFPCRPNLTVILGIEE